MRLPEPDMRLREPDMKRYEILAHLFISGSYLSYLAQLCGDIGFWISKYGGCIDDNSGVLIDNYRGTNAVSSYLAHIF